MLLTSKVRKEETVTKDVQLPYYCKTGSSYYRVNEDKSIFKVTTIRDIDEKEIVYGNISLIKKTDDKDFEVIVSAHPSSAAEMQQATQDAVDYMDAQISLFKNKTQHTDLAGYANNLNKLTHS